MDSDEALAAKFAALLPHLNERQRRLVLGAEARALGRGGVKAVARAAGASAMTVSRGMAELRNGSSLPGRARRPGGGRKPVAATDPGAAAALLSLIESDEAAPLLWTTRSTRQLARALADAGHSLSAPTIAKLLRDQGFSLLGNAKAIDGGLLADRDVQFRHACAQAADHLGSRDPVIALGIAKTMLPGTEAEGRWENAEADQHTAGLAVATIRAWWHRSDRRGTRLLIVADAGGATAYRTDRWAVELSALADDTGLPLTVCHLPPGTSRWSGVEGRINARLHVYSPGQTSRHEVVVSAVGADIPADGLPAEVPSTDRWPLGGRRVVMRHESDGAWNYGVVPRSH